jgi:predicted nucleic acid-binding Zn ribbon protein
MPGRWERAGDVLASLLANRGLQEGIRRHTAIQGWEEVVGRRIAERAVPQGIRGKTLFVDVNGSSWIHELSFLKADILRKLNERVGGGAIEEIVFTACGEKGGPRRAHGTRTGRERQDG